LRGVTAEIEAYLQKNHSLGKLSNLYAGLDALGRTPWRVNEDLLKHMITAWNSDMPIAGLPAEIASVVPDPPKPDGFDTDMMVRRQWYREYRTLRQAYYDNKGLRATENYKLEIARAVRHFFV
jgi:DNA-directed RNA polymerase